MAILNVDGVVSVFDADGYEEELEVIDCGESGSVYVGTIHVPKIYVGSKAVINIIFSDGE